MKMSHPLPKMLAVALIAIGAVVIFAYYYQTAGGTLPLSSKAYTVTAEIADSQGLLKHADVRAAGVKIGTVSNISNTSTADGTETLVQMQLTKQFAPVYKNATVLIRQKTLVGENYIEITRGTPNDGTVPNYGMLPVSADLESVPLDKILNALTPKVRRETQVDLQALGNGLRGEGTNLNNFLGALQPTVYNGGQVFAALNGQRQEVADVVQQTGTVMQALANRTQELQTLIRSGETTAEAVAARDQALATSFQDLPATLQQARTSVRTLASFSGLATPVVSNLRVAVTKLDPVMVALKPTAAAAQTLFKRLPAFLKVANPLLTNLKSFAKVSEPAIPAIDSFMQQADPIATYLKPYYRDLGAFLQNFGGTIDRENISGTYIGRCVCPVSEQSFANQTPQEQVLIEDLIKAGGLGGIANPATNELRAPGTAPDADTPYSGAPYPHILALAPANLTK
jgi:phospholipid/cholesterol/gamma-HCH transport system substrate-binding protein